MSAFLINIYKRLFKNSMMIRNIQNYFFCGNEMFGNRVDICPKIEAVLFFCVIITNVWTDFDDFQYIYIYVSYVSYVSSNSIYMSVI